MKGVRWQKPQGFPFPPFTHCLEAQSPVAWLKTWPREGARLLGWAGLRPLEAGAAPPLGCPSFQSIFPVSA